MFRFAENDKIHIMNEDNPKVEVSGSKDIDTPFSAIIIFIIGAIIAFAFLAFEKFFLFLLTIFITGIISSSIHGEHKRKILERENKIKGEIEESKRKAEIDRITPIYNNAKAELISNHGEPDKSISLEELNIDKEIIAFGETNHIWILGKMYPMTDIINCTFTDNPRVEKGSITYETKTKTGNMAKRALVGGALVGGAGAIVGGTTAKKETTAIQSEDKTYHNYTVIINVNSLSDPIIRIPLGEDGKTVNEIVGLFSVIINRNMQASRI